MYEVNHRPSGTITKHVFDVDYYIRIRGLVPKSEDEHTKDLYHALETWNTSMACHILNQHFGIRVRINGKPGWADAEQMIEAAKALDSIRHTRNGDTRS